MKLDPVLLEILVCPDCKGSLTVDYEHEELICNQCGLIYPVRDDIPVMLVEEARRPEPPPAVVENDPAPAAAEPPPAAPGNAGVVGSESSSEPDG
jgi:uncharacterized protein YbaR (Trm112 family)